MRDFNAHTIRQMYRNNVFLYKSLAKAQRVPPEAKDWIYGNAMAHTLFDMNQKATPMGIFNAASGTVAALKEQFMIEVVPFARMSDAVRDDSFIDYCRWSRLSEQDVDTDILAQEVDRVLADLTPDQLEALIGDAERYDFRWLEISLLG